MGKRFTVLFSSLTDDLQLSESSFVISQTHFKGVSILLLFSPLSPSLNENLVVPLVIRVQYVDAAVQQDVLYYVENEQTLF